MSCPNPTDSAENVQEKTHEILSANVGASAELLKSSGEVRTSLEEKMNDNIKAIVCPACKIQLLPDVHKFCYGCGQNVQQIYSSMLQLGVIESLQQQAAETPEERTSAPGDQTGDTEQANEESNERKPSPTESLPSTDRGEVDTKSFHAETDDKIVTKTPLPDEKTKKKPNSVDPKTSKPIEHNEERSAAGTENANADISHPTVDTVSRADNGSSAAIIIGELKGQTLLSYNNQSTSVKGKRPTLRELAKSPPLSGTNVSTDSSTENEGEFKEEKSLSKDSHSKFTERKQYTPEEMAKSLHPNVSTDSRTENEESNKCTERRYVKLDTSENYLKPLDIPASRDNAEGSNEVHELKILGGTENANADISHPTTDTVSRADNGSLTAIIKSEVKGQTSLSNDSQSTSVKGKRPTLRELAESHSLSHTNVSTDSPTENEGEFKEEKSLSKDSHSEFTERKQYTPEEMAKSLHPNVSTDSRTENEDPDECTTEHRYVKSDLPENNPEPHKRRKSEKSNKKKRKMNMNVPPVKKNVPPNGITIVFHAVLSPRFVCENDTLVFIRGQDPIFNGWDSNAVKITRKEESGYILLHGKHVVALENARREVAYKYVLVDGDVGRYEELVEFSTLFESTNRCLAIPEGFRRSDGIWHKYDGFVYPEPGLLSGVMTKIQSKDREFVQDRKEFFKLFFPKWSGFHTNSYNCKLSAVIAVQELDNLVESISNVRTMKEHHFSVNNVLSHSFQFPELIRDLLSPKLHANRSVTSCETSDTSTIVHALISSVVITYVFYRHHVNLTDELLEEILKCFKVPPKREVCDSLIEELRQFENGALRNVSKSICNFYNETRMTKYLRDWLHAIPLLHFLRGNPGPFAKVESVKTVKYGDWKWWGLELIKVRSFRIADSREAVDMLPSLVNLFDMDRLLPRSFLLLSPVDVYGDLLVTGHFSILELCVTMKKLLPDMDPPSFTDNFLKRLAAFFSKVNRRLSDLSFQSMSETDSVDNEVLLETLMKILKYMKKFVALGQIAVLCRMVETVITLVKLQTDYADHQDSLEEMNDQNNTGSSFFQNKLSVRHSRFLEDAAVIISRLLVEKRGYNLEDTAEIDVKCELGAWNEILSVAAPDTFHEFWHDIFKQDFKNRITQVSPIRAIEIFRFSDGLHLNQDVASFLSQAAFKAVDELVKLGQKDQVTAFHHLTNTPSQGCVDLLSAMLYKAWPLKNVSQTNGDEILLNHILTWPTWPGFLKFFGGCSSKILPGNGRKIMAEAESFVEHLINSVGDGSVTVATLETLKKHENQFLKLAEVHPSNQGKLDEATNIKSICTAITERTAEQKTFLTQKEQLNYFVGICDSFYSVNKELVCLREKLKEDFNARPVRDLCVRGSSGLVVTFFNLDPEVQEMISKVYGIQTSQIFNKLWYENSKKQQSECTTMRAICNMLWLPLNQDLMSIKEQFICGDMQIEVVDKYLKMFQDNNLDDLEEEFNLLLKQFRDPKLRLDVQEQQLAVTIGHIKEFRKLFSGSHAAQEIINLKNVRGLKGNFKEVESIAKINQGSFSTQPIKSIGPELVNAGKKLEAMSEDKTSCLSAFANCLELVNWLRENIQDQQQLKVFVDLAMISAGESDLEIDRISLMHTCCLGFSSLIFNLQSEHGFEDLMRLCKPVWQAVEANPSLPAKLESTNRHLSWLKEIKESHGSVTLTTLTQVEAINASGVYHIPGRELPNSGRGSKNNLKNTVSLLVSREDDRKIREERTYDLDEIKDVQSKLMLIAGKAEKGKDDVDQFVEVFEGVLSVSSLYEQLCEIGEINYLTWRTEFQCSKVGDRRERLLDDIRGTCEKMEHDLTSWKEKIDGIRKECYSLNHFTLKQILKLRKNLASACTGQVPVDELPLQTFMLLKSVYNDVEPRVLARVLQEVVDENSVFLSERACSDDQRYFSVNDDERSATIQEPTPFKPLVNFPSRISNRQNSFESFANARKTLERMGYGEEIIVAALYTCGRKASEEDLVSWVVSNKFDDEVVETLYRKALGDPELSDLLVDFMDIEPWQIKISDEEELVVATRDGRNFARKLPSSRTAETYVKNNAETYLSLSTLAAVLERLSSSETAKLTRKFPTNLKEGEPNLLLVPRGEIFGCILTLFMADGDQDLPSDEEVIVCDERTTAEEIELLWRRAVVNESGLLFCLANADLLDYDVSQQAFNALEHITQGKSSYRVVVICSIENEDRSNMVASLDQFRRQFSALTSQQGVQDYLKRQFATIGENKTIGDVPWYPAAMADNDHLSVRVVQSSRAGVGKSLVVKRLKEKLENLPNNQRLRPELISTFCPTIPVHGVSVNCDKVTRAFAKHAVKPDIPVSRIFHLDISQSIFKGLDTFLFKLLILKTIKDSSGNVWRRNASDMYIIEITTDKTFSSLISDDALLEPHFQQGFRKRRTTSKYSFLKFLPRTRCLTPREILFNMQHNCKEDTEFDIEKFHSEEYQRAFQYLRLFDGGQNLDNFTFQRQAVFEDAAEALKTTIKYCGIRDPSWAELHHFVNFLNSQLRDCEESIFCDTTLVGDHLRGFRTFVVGFLIQMSRDFATPSLRDDNLTTDDSQGSEEDDDLAPFQIRRRWESSPHPYIFFNQDHNSMTFLGFLLSSNGDLLNPATNQVLESQLMHPSLRGQLKAQGVDFDKNYETWDRMTRITNLCRVMGIENLYDPDETYELTTDNIEKILAIHLRFRCGIPVIIMGETGCGKTRLIRFMCELQAGPDGPKNMLLMKVHGGTSYEDIESKVEEAEKLAEINSKVNNVDTVLFFDEANTTDAIDLIKEIMVDRRVNGRPISPKLSRLHFIAACNPYRKHTKEMIQKLESAGLGYHVSAEETEDKLGSIPLRQLVYRVHPLPESMRPLVWDFGQLTDHTEELYTKQIVKRFFKNTRRNTSSHLPDIGSTGTDFTGTLSHMAATVSENSEFIPGNESQVSCIARVLSASQKYMRRKKDECSFVSLRDVERAMKVITWFYANSELISRIVRDQDDEDNDSHSDDESGDDDAEEEVTRKPLRKIVRALVLGIGVCYYARLHNREKYCEYIAKQFTKPCSLPGGAERIMSEIKRCQRAFLDDITLGENIARNAALSENVFMMAICTELRIPLYVIGKPGSSKSLAKDVISTHMKGDASQGELFPKLKEIHMQSYQCSPLSTPEGIVSTFRQCSKLQRDKNLKKYVSVVVLDEIGLAEDSPLMPLKTLHPLLEDGTATEEDTYAPEHLRVGFIGLSNWALDPAKMNRGIMLSRGVPSVDELKCSAEGICASNERIQDRMMPTINDLAHGYDELYKEQKSSKTLEQARKEEFFGLRDFYSLVKMVYGFAAQHGHGHVSEVELEQAIRRNFSGLDDLNPMEIFVRYFPSLECCLKYPSPESYPVSLIVQSLDRTSNEGESRYLLVLTENYAALRILQEQFLQGNDHDPVIIFGSSFPKDQQYTQICRNINKIKVCMETGKMVILLNLESLYESLYDALNQYYLKLGDQKYVDLGLGNHRVKCRVAEKFKLIVVAEKDDVYKRFPIPLINRLEKHFLVMSTSLTEEQAVLVDELRKWVEEFSDAKPELQESSSFKPGDSFVGYHSDTAAAVILKISKHQTDYQMILEESKYTLLQCASPDAIARLPASKLNHHAEELWNVYFEDQQHRCLSEYLEHAFDRSKQIIDRKGLLVQITTHSRLLSQSDAKAISTTAGFPGSRSRCISLQEFYTEQQFTKTIQDFVVQLGGDEGLLLIQCDNGEANFHLIACCRYIVVDVRRTTLEDLNGEVQPIHVVFLIQLPKIAGGCQNFVGFQGGKWTSIHIDELQESNEPMPRIEQLVNRSVSEILRPANAVASDDVEDVDVDYDFEKSDENIKSSHGSTVENSNLVRIVRSCLQAAAARVYDESANADRATRHVEILLNLLPENASLEKEFSQIIVRRVHHLLQQRDEKIGLNQKLWLRNEALSRGRLQETGTFRKALWKRLSSIVTPMLSEVIALADRNQNLTLVLGEDNWKTRLWLAMLNDQKVVLLSYESFISPISGVIRERARVVSTGLGHRFQGKFPFSWIIKDLVNLLLIQVEANSSVEVLNRLRGVIKASPLGRLCLPILEETGVKQEAMMEYLHDFVHMVYRPMVEDEMKLVSDAVITAARGVHDVLNSSDEFELDFALIHFAYSLIQTRLSNFSDLVHACPTRVLQKLFRLPDKLNIPEMNLDVVTLQCCLEELEPTREELESSELRLIWCNRVQRACPTMQVMARQLSEMINQSQETLPINSRLRSFGSDSTRIMHNCRFNWIRLSVVRLFIEHTCPPGVPTHEADAQNAFRLWKSLGDNPDFASIESTNVVERFLSDCSDNVSKRYIKFGITQCPICQCPLEEPVQLPCRHVCCNSCAERWLANNNTCPICRQDVGDGFNIAVSQECSKALEEYNDFRTRCKSFFMELVALYCFGEEALQPPSPELVTKFIGYVIKADNKTGDFTPFDGQGIDATPVVRSFILQQLLANKKDNVQKRVDQVREHLEDYLRRAGHLVVDRDDMIEVCVLCVQCMEDTEMSNALKLTADTQILMATKTLEGSLQNSSIDMRIPPEVVNVDTLQTVAATRAALDVLSTYLDENYVAHLEKYKNLARCIQVANNLCNNTSRSPVRLFLLKLLVRRYGVDAVKERCKDAVLQWILPLRDQQQEAISDSFIVHHDNYHEIRDALAKALLTCSTDDLDSMLQDLVATPSARDCYILLALFREVTTCYAMGDIHGKISVKVLDKINEFILQSGHLSDPLKPLGRSLLNNTLNGNVIVLKVAPDQSANVRRLTELLLHYRIVLESLPQNALLQPLRNLAFNTAQMRTSYLPTMPHDYGVETMQVNLGRWYECPNGHRYVISECGRPNHVYNCPACDAAIGEAGHDLALGNRDASREDTTSTGHIIGQAQNQSLSFTSERNLTPLACGVLRLITHAAMLLGADQNIQNVAAIIKPCVPDVIQFLQAHIVRDIRCLANSTGNNEDEALLIIHLVLKTIIEQETQYQDNVNIDPRLLTKESRATWENTFMVTYLNPILSTLSEQLQDSFGRMVRDERLGNDPLMRQLYELDTPNYDVMAGVDAMCPALWRYRTRVSVEHLNSKFQEYIERRDESSKCEILEEFLKKEHHLRALQFLPDILKLQRHLSEKFHRRMDRNEAETFTLGNFLRRTGEMKKQFTALVDSFRRAWKLVRSSLSQNGRLSIPTTLCELDVTNDTPILMFLPTNSGYGRCALGLTSFLVTLHNEFIGRCKTILEDESSSDDVPLANVTKAHIAAYDLEKDLLPMILAHCDYSLKVGEGTIVEYNWKALERQLVDRFVRGRSRLTSMVELFVFSKDVCDGKVFSTLKQKIHQVELSRPVQDQILNELTQLTDICDVLKSLHIAIGFLSSAGGQPLMLISEYLHMGLKMPDKDGLKSFKAQQVCQIRHIISLWRLLSLERAKLLTRHKQDPFDDVPDKVKIQLNRNQTFELSRGLRKLNVDQILSELLEVILLYLKHVPDEQLHCPLFHYLNAKLEEKECDAIEDLAQHLPEDILLEHAVETWKMACQKSEDYHGRT